MHNTSTNQPGQLRTLETALWALEIGLWPVPITPIDDPSAKCPGKQPIGRGWGRERPTVASLEASYRRHPRAGVGLLLGCQGGVIAVDIDDPATAEPVLKRMFPTEPSNTLGWTTSRGSQRLFLWNDRLAEYGQTIITGKSENGKIKSNPHYLGIELRIGTIDPAKPRQTQSVIPPSLMANGKPRRWIDPAAEILPVPESVFADLDRYALVRHYDRAAVQEACKPHLLTLAREWGLRLTGDQQGEWATCRAISREDTTPSAGLSLESGVFHDFGTGTKISLFDLAVRLGAFLDWKSAVNALGERFGVAPARTGHKPVATAAPASLPAESNGQAESPNPIDLLIGMPALDLQPTEAVNAILVNDRDLPGVVADVNAALQKWNGEHGELYEYLEKPAWIKTPVGDQATTFAENLTPHAFRLVIGEVSHFAMQYETKRGTIVKEVFPPLDLVNALLAQKHWNGILPHLEMVCDTPRFLPSGELLSRPGYYPTDFLLYQPAAELSDLEIPERPTAREVEQAKALIFEHVFVDFPFADQASRANALAAMLLFFVRLLIQGATPLHMFESSTEGTGKGKLGWSCAFPALGRDIASTSQKENEAEWRKAITTALISGSPFIFVDNMNNPRAWNGELQPVDSGTLAAALSQPLWTDRLLATNRDVTINIRAIFYASGNNVEWSKELIRRVVPIRLLPTCENPSDRSGFLHDPLETWMRQNRRELVRACLTLCRAWLAAGCPAGRQRLGSYEDYARVMGGILDTTGVPGFLENRPKLAGRDRESIRWPALVAAWFKARGTMTTSAGYLFDLIFGELNQGTQTGGKPDLAVAFADVVGDGKELSQKQKLGHALSKQEGRVWQVGDDAFRIVRSAAKDMNGSTLYKLTSDLEASCDETEVSEIPF